MEVCGASRPAEFTFKSRSTTRNAFSALPRTERAHLRRQLRESDQFLLPRAHERGPGDAGAAAQPRRGLVAETPRELSRLL